MLCFRLRNASPLTSSASIGGSTISSKCWRSISSRSTEAGIRTRVANTTTGDRVPSPRNDYGTLVKVKRVDRRASKWDGAPGRCWYATSPTKIQSGIPGTRRLL
jgi:hypothetical protein